MSVEIVSLDKVNITRKGTRLTFSKSMKSVLKDNYTNKKHLKFQNCFSLKKAFREISYLELQDGVELDLSTFDVEFSDSYLIVASPEVNWKKISKSSSQKKPSWSAKLTYSGVSNVF